MKHKEEHLLKRITHKALKSSKIATFAIASTWLCSCASMSTTESGFLKSYDHMHENPDSEYQKIYEKKGVDWKNYHFVVIEPSVFHSSATQEKPVPQEEQNKLTHYFAGILARVFTDGFTVLKEPLNESLIIRSAITDIDSAQVSLNFFSSILAVPVDNGGISVELEILDGTTQERLFAIATCTHGSPLEVGGFFDKYGHARSGIRQISTAIYDHLKKYRN